MLDGIQDYSMPIGGQPINAEQGRGQTRFKFVGNKLFSVVLDPDDESPQV